MPTDSTDPVHRRGPDGAPGSARSAGPPAESGLVVLATGFTFLLGLWLIASPRLLDHGAGDSGRGVGWDDVVIGVAVAALSLAHGAAPTALYRLSWMTAALGAWLVVLPITARFHGGDTSRSEVNDVLVGALLVLAATGAALGGAEAKRKVQRARTGGPGSARAKRKG